MQRILLGVVDALKIYIGIFFPLVLFPMCFIFSLNLIFTSNRALVTSVRSAQALFINNTVTEHHGGRCA